MTPTSNAFRGLKLLHLALFISLSACALVALVLIETGVISHSDHFEDMEDIFQAVAGVCSMVNLLGGFTLFRKRIVAIRQETAEGEKKMEMYRSACRKNNIVLLLKLTREEAKVLVGV